MMEAGDPDSPWSGDGGHVLLSNGKGRVLRRHQRSRRGRGVFNVASKDDDDDDAQIEKNC